MKNKTKTKEDASELFSPGDDVEGGDEWRNLEEYKGRENISYLFVL